MSSHQLAYYSNSSFFWYEIGLPKIALVVCMLFHQVVRRRFEFSDVRPMAQLFGLRWLWAERCSSGIRRLSAGDST